MRHHTRIAIVSGAVGFGFAGVLQVAALLAAQAELGGLARVVDWPTTLLGSLAPNDAVALFAGLPLGAVVYSIAAYLILRRTLAEGS